MRGPLPAPRGLSAALGGWLHAVTRPSKAASVGSERGSVFKGYLSPTLLPQGTGDKRSSCTAGRGAR